MSAEIKTESTKPITAKGVGSKDYTTLTGAPTTRARRNLFVEGFETGDFRNFSGIAVGAGDSIQVVASPVYQGNYAAQAQVLGVSPHHAWCYRQIPATQATLHVRMYINFPAAALLYSSLIWLYDAYGNPLFQLFVTNMGTAFTQFGIVTYAGSPGTFVSAPFSASPNTWYCVELGVNVDPAAGWVQAWWEGVSILQQQGLNTGTTNTSIVYFGLPYGSTNPCTYYFDSIIIADAYIGPETLMVSPESTKISGTANTPVKQLMDGTLVVQTSGQTALPNGAILLASFGTGVPDLTGVGLNGNRDAFELANGNWLITDMLNHRVIEVNPKTKAIVWQYGTTGVSGSGANQLNQPYSAIRLANGDTLIADTINHRIIEVTPNNTIAWSVDTSTFGLGTVQPTSVQMTDENTIVCGSGTNGVAKVLEIAYPAGTLTLDWSTHCVPALSFPTYAHKIQGNEVAAATDFNHWHHMLIVDFNLGEFYNMNVDGTLNFATARYAPLGSAGVAGKGALECVDMWGDRIALLTSSWVGAVIAYVKAEKLDKLALLFGNKSATTWGGLGRVLPFIEDSGYFHRTPDGNLLVSDYGACTVYKVTPSLTKFLSPSPLYLWSGQSITDTVNGSTTPGFLTIYADKKTFYVISNQTGTLNIQAYDEVAGAFKTIASMAVAANTLTPYMTTYGARLMALNFVPTAGATVSAWAILD